MGEGQGTPRVNGSIEPVALKDIKFEDSRFQYRINPQTKDLVDSLRLHGQQAPITLWGCNGAPYIVIDGYRRATAAKSLGWTNISAIIRRGLTEDQAYQIAYIENAKRCNLRAIDIANAIRIAKARGKTREELVKSFDFSERQYERYQELLILPEEVEAALRDGLIQMAHALVLKHAQDIDYAEWVERIQKDKISSNKLSRDLRHKLKTGRKRLYIKLETDGFRLYPMRFGKGTSKQERLKMIEVLQQAVELLKADN